MPASPSTDVVTLETRRTTLTTGHAPARRSARMSENLRKQILISVCIHVCMTAAGLLQMQYHSMHELRNLRRKTKGLPPLQPGEDAVPGPVVIRRNIARVSVHDTTASVSPRQSPGHALDRRTARNYFEAPYRLYL